MHLPKWEKLTQEEQNLIHLIVDRAKIISSRSGTTIDKAQKTSLLMDLCFHHLKSPLDLDRLLMAPEFDLLHDLHGIHTSRGGLFWEFKPRCSLESSYGNH